jgi:hypothetical protein
MKKTCQKASIDHFSDRSVSAYEQVRPLSGSVYFIGILVTDDISSLAILDCRLQLAIGTEARLPEVKM